MLIKFCIVHLTHRILSIGFLLLFGLGCKSSPTSAESDTESNSETCKVLFIGSSYLDQHEVPGLFQRLAIQNDKSVFIKRDIINGTYLDYHSNSMETENIINQYDWDFVIMQGGCQNIAYPEDHHLIFPPYQQHPVAPALQTLYNKIKNNCETTLAVYFMPWAFEDGTTWLEGQNDTYMDMQLNIYSNTLDMAREIGLVIAPIGWAFRSVLQDHSELHYLYLSDYNHPSQRGSYLAACVIYATIFRESAVGIPYSYKLSVEEATYLRSVASTVVLDNLELWNNPPTLSSNNDSR